MKPMVLNFSGFIIYGDDKEVMIQKTTIEMRLCFQLGELVIQLVDLFFEGGRAPAGFLF